MSIPWDIVAWIAVAVVGIAVAAAVVGIGIGIVLGPNVGWDAIALLDEIVTQGMCNGTGFQKGNLGEIVHDGFLGTVPYPYSGSYHDTHGKVDRHRDCLE
eukprot:scaffold60807_cov62-Attheya_sp.AAC.3